MYGVLWQNLVEIVCVENRPKQQKQTNNILYWKIKTKDEKKRIKNKEEEKKHHFSIQSRNSVIASFSVSNKLLLFLKMKREN